MIENVDYLKFKLLILSILWRAHISQNRFFKKVDIGNHESTIRKMLLNHDPGSELDFKISIVGIKDKNNDLVRILPDPEVKNVETMYLASFFIGGFVYFISLDPKTKFSLFEKTYLKENKIEIPLIDGEIANQFLKALGIPNNIVEYFAPSNAD